MSARILHISWGPDAREYTGRESSAKWCLKCRRRRVQKEVMLYDSQPSYYDPGFAWECPCEERQCPTDPQSVPKNTHTA